MNAAAQSQANSVLVMSQIYKAYPGVQALEDVTLEVLPGEVHALVGENGAGKSTLMKILAGAESMDEGRILIEGRPAAIHKPADAKKLGVGMIYQEFNLVDEMMVYENIFLGKEPVSGAGFIRKREMIRRTRETLERLKTGISPTDYISSLSVAQKQMVEIAKALSERSLILVMDEPTATLTEHEIDSLFEIIRSLKQNEGLSVIYISHRLEELPEIADRLTVMRDGKTVGVSNVADVTRDDIITMMVGREIKEKTPKKKVEIGDVRLKVQGLTVKDVFHDISFEVRRGEILGITGLVGARRTEVVRTIFGADRFDSGGIWIDGREVVIRNPNMAIANGIGLATEDRKQQGLILEMPVTTNTTLAGLGTITHLGFINKGRERSDTKDLVDQLGIRTPTLVQLVRNLSGGNQQKVVLAKWLFTKCKVLIFDEPTRGIDVGAKVDIYNLMGDLAMNGVSIIMVSSELPEVLGMSDRIIVMHEGRIAGELARSEATQEKIMFLATGGE